MTGTLKLGLLTPVLSLSPGKHAAWEVEGSIDDVATIATRADGLGYEYLTCSEHVAVPVDREGPLPPGHTRGPRYWDPLPTFGYLAARTNRIRFTTLIVVLSYHHPLAIGKRYGTLDVLSRGRLNLGVGVGYLKPEFELLGAEYQGRNERADDAIRAIRASFGRSRPEYHGPFFSFSGIVVDPCGIQAPPPIWIGGRTRRSLRRALEVGDVWCPFSLTVDELADFIKEAADTSAWRDRRDPLDVAASTTVDPLGAPDQTTAHLADLVAAGATLLTLRFKHQSREQYLEQLEAMVDLAARRGLVEGTR